MVTALVPHHVGMVSEAAGFGGACLKGATWGLLRGLLLAAGVYLRGLPSPFDVGCRGSWRNAGETCLDSSRREGGQVRPHRWG